MSEAQNSSLRMTDLLQDLESLAARSCGEEPVQRKLEQISHKLAELGAMFGSMQGFIPAELTARFDATAAEFALLVREANGAESLADVGREFQTLSDTIGEGDESSDRMH